MMSQALREAIHQTKPFASLELEVFLGLRLVSLMLRDPWAHYLRAHGELSLSQYNLLRILRGGGDGGLHMGVIASRMIHRDPDVTRLVDRLRNRGLVTRSRDSSDRRVVAVRITPAGLDLLASLDGAAREFPIPLLGFLGEGRLHQLDHILGQIIEQRPTWP